MTNRSATHATRSQRPDGEKLGHIEKANEKPLRDTASLIDSVAHLAADTAPEVSDPTLPVFGFYKDALTEALRITKVGQSSVAQFEPFYEYRDDPTAFSEKVLGWSPWSKQSEIGASLVESQRTTVVSCNGAGKTVWAARLLLWFMYTRKNALVITTAPTYNQVTLLWRQVRLAHNNAKYELPGDVLSTSRLELAPAWYAQGIATDREERFQGYHGEGVSDDPRDGGIFVIVDEASGVKDYVFDAMRGYLTQPNAYVLLIGNGNRSEGAFHESHTKGNWDRFSISAYDVPEAFLSRAWIEEQRGHWGEDSPQYAVRVLGQFPKMGSDWQLIPYWLLIEAKDAKPDGEEVHIGVDIARGRGDLNVAVVTQGGVVTDCRSWHEDDLMRTVKNIEELSALHRCEGQNIHIDVIGIGAGVVDRMREKGVAVDAVEFGGRPLGDYLWLLGSDFRALNRKAELHWAGRTLLQKKEAAIPDTYEDTIWKQLQWPAYSINERGAVSIEAKERLRVRFGESPDFADAWVISLSRASTQPRIFIV